MIVRLSSFLEDAHPERYRNAAGDVALVTEADMILEFLEDNGMLPPGWSEPGKVYYMGGTEKTWEAE